MVILARVRGERQWLAQDLRAIAKAGDLDLDKGDDREEALDRVRAIRLTPASRVMPLIGLAELYELRRRTGLDAPADIVRSLAAAPGEGPEGAVPARPGRGGTPRRGCRQALNGRSLNSISTKANS